MMVRTTVGRLAAQLAQVAEHSGDAQIDVPEEMADALRMSSKGRRFTLHEDDSSLIARIAAQQRAFEEQRQMMHAMQEKSISAQDELELAKRKIVNMRAQLRHFNRVLNSRLARAMRVEVGE